MVVAFSKTLPTTVFEQLQAAIRQLDLPSRLPGPAIFAIEPPSRPPEFATLVASEFRWCVPNASSAFRIPLAVLIVVATPLTERPGTT